MYVMISLPYRNTIRRQDDLYVVPKPLKVAASTNNEESAYYKVPRPSPHSSSSGSDEDRHGIYSSRAFSPDHYELGPSDSEETPIYENTDFDHPFDASEGYVHKTVYQNTSFDGVSPSSVNQTNKLPLKKYGSPQLRKLPSKPILPPNKPTSHKPPLPNKDLDNEYINPEEFTIAEDDLSHKLHKSTGDYYTLFNCILMFP